MQIIVPMSGFGERFRKAGYTVPKPLIEVDGKPIIEWVVGLFPGETDFLFICNEDHLAEPAFRMREILQRCCPMGRVVGIPPHKLGPVHAVLQASEFIRRDSPVVVNYCDFACFWDWQDFRRFVAETRCAGAIPSYKGFHPHSLGSTNYAYLRETGGWIEDIQEKRPFTDNRMEEYASSGTYYFETGALMESAFRGAIERDLNTGGEFYVSLAYKELFARKLPVAVYPLQHFMQWGTPEDLAEYLGWSQAFRKLIQHRVPTPSIGSQVVLLAGLGQRFAREGYGLPKPLIPVSGRPMVVQAASDLPPPIESCFVLRRDMPGEEQISAELAREFSSAVIETIPGVTEGQACTAIVGLDALERRVGVIPGPITIASCDFGVLYDAEALPRLLKDDTVDVVVWAVRGHANAVRHPEMFGWIDAVDGRIRRVSVKAPLASPATDPLVLGTFTFRKAEDLRRVVSRLIDRGIRVNNEFYLDSCINEAIALGLNCHVFEVDHYLSWGTPNDLRTFEYWQSCFHKWSEHPYRLERDGRIPAAARPDLEARYRIPARPKQFA
ncbi:NTP transferase domain-containing protein [Rhodopseudomonas telluris]|uniref:NTP transferase domain-containing protein n=1 Tax=Rhodopseudomonas telluris TaxID=644215 RepID=A0ABV6EQB5_9BRAD